MWPNQKQKDRAVLPKPKLIVYIGRSQTKFLNLTQTPKTAPKGSKKGPKDPNCGQNKNKKMRLYFHTINYAIKVFFKLSLLGFIDATVIGILDLILTTRYLGIYSSVLSFDLVKL